ncbi:MAG TPA: OmpA family protein [Zoogloea sp.]|uniref:OmpA family protein n=1 Tax=Zoogloea sp. TaxID=49181 RepID=UPI002C4B3F68|nr:OmpA family protein [Zoogloea sp.]HMV19135.1 OmpA family protein [Rhodocyclaceae bacterium]HMV65066.1 OmpA family protein [Rhodocyclaceae bacterium]HMW53780.1 OmpA family protein [Rhodocyclaceae bacterium]HMY48659.1 OmpA family protein [Rhodocyclaceae bacterium]HMZ75513.1 OmpA family protein [Rhodocyclaceae bacterium]
MIKQAKKQLLMAAALATLGLTASASFAKDVVVDTKGEVPYVIDGRNVVARSGADLCWRTGYWTPAAASTTMAGEFPVGCECDKDVVAKEKCEPKAAAPAAGAKGAAPIAAPAPVSEKVKLAADTLFDFDKAVLLPAGKTKLDDLADKAKGLNLEVILAVGHTDRIGGDAYNQKLSEKRAAAVKDYLVSKGVAANRVYTEGKGKKQPVTGDKCKGLGKDNGKNKKLVECLQPDRRVEIEVIGTK